MEVQNVHGAAHSTMVARWLEKPVSPPQRRPSQRQRSRRRTHRKLLRPLVSTTSTTPSPGMMAANCTGVPRTRCTARPMPPCGDRSESSNPPPGLQSWAGGARWQGSGGRAGGRGWRAAAPPN